MKLVSEWIERNLTILYRLTLHFEAVMSILFCGLMVTLPSAANQELTLSASEQQQILTEFSRLLLEHYVIPEKANSYAGAMKSAVDKGEYSTARSTREFISQTNKMIQATYADKHLSLLSPEKFQEVMAMFHPEQSEIASENAEHKSPAAHGVHAIPPHEMQAGTVNNRNHRPGIVQAENAVAKSLAEIGIGSVSEISRDGLNQIGFLEILRFDGSKRSRRFIDRVFSTFTESDGIIIDLRRCKGGDASMVKFISSYFFDEPTHLLSSTVGVDQEGNRSPVERWATPNQLSDQFANKPLKILLSSKTFSAAESFAFAMQALGRAELIGETTGGGGYMSDFYPLPYRLGASISIGRTFDPRTGKDWQGRGVVPGLKVDSEVALTTALDGYTVESGKLTSIAEDNDKFEIYKTLQSYTNAWYGADQEAMMELLSDNFQATHINPTGVELPGLTKSQLVKQTAEGRGTRINKIHENRIIKNIELKDDTATVTLVLRETVHKMQLQKSGDIWRIYSDIFRDKVHG